jgi:putative ABC transport system substrate-binding protein
MRRRDLFLAAAMFVGISPAAAQQPPAHARIGWLAHGDTMPRHSFDEALARLGWVEGKNLALERRFAGSTGERLAADAAELVSWHPDVIVAMGTVDAYPILALTRTVPIVVVTSNDLVGQGLATSLARPGGNVTGTASVTSALVPKLLELAHELIPEAGRVSVLGDPRNPGNIELRLPSASRSVSRSSAVTPADPRSSMQHSPRRPPTVIGQWSCSSRR